LDPLNSLVTLILGKIKEGLYAQWLKFLFQLAFTGLISFLFTCGSVLVKSRSVALGIGTGMVVASMAMVLLFRRAPGKLTAGMDLVLPAAEAAQEMVTDWQMIQKSKETK